MLSKTKFGKYVLSVMFVSLVAGCASTEQRILPSPHTLASFKPDCNMAQQQLEWLRSLRPTVQERRNALFEVQMWGGFSKDFRKNKDIVDNKVDYLIDINIDEIYYRCKFLPGLS